MAEIISEVGSELRSAAKQLIKGGLVVSKALSGFAAETGEQFKGLVMEARTELREPHASRSAEAEIEAGGLRDHMIKAGHAVCDAASNMASRANEALAALVALIAGESKEKAQRQVEKDEEALKHLGKRLAEVEAINVIETLILVAA